MAISSSPGASLWVGQLEQTCASWARGERAEGGAVAAFRRWSFCVSLPAEVALADAALTGEPRPFAGMLFTPVPRGYRVEVHLVIDGEAQPCAASFLVGQTLCVVVEPLRDGARVEVRLALAPGQGGRPVRLRGLAARLRRFGHSFVLERRRPPTASEVAGGLGLDLREARGLIERTRSPVCEESAARGALPRLVLGEPRPYRAPALTPEEERSLRARFGIAAPADETLEELGQAFEVTRERIRPISARALRRLRHPSRSKALEKFIDE